MNAIQKTPNHKSFVTTIKLTTKIWTDAYQWVELNPKMFEEKEDEMKRKLQEGGLTQEDVQI